MSAPANGYLDEDWRDRRVFEGEDFLEEKADAANDAYAAARAERARTGYREMTGREGRDSLVGEA